MVRDWLNLMLINFANKLLIASFLLSPHFIPLAKGCWWLKDWKKQSILSFFNAAQIKQSDSFCDKRGKFLVLLILSRSISRYERTGGRGKSRASPLKPIRWYGTFYLSSVSQMISCHPHTVSSRLLDASFRVVFISSCTTRQLGLNKTSALLFKT